MAQETHQPTPKRGKKKIVLALVLVLVVVGGVVGFLFYSPSKVQVSIRDLHSSPTTRALRRYS